MFQERSELIRICVSALESRGLTDPKYKQRLKLELKEIDAQAEHQHLLDLHRKFQAEKLIYPENENNLLVDYLLGLAHSVDIDSPPRWVQGEFPDIDIDYIKAVRDYLKRDWAPHEFGQDKICEIGTYGTSGIKSAILDMTGVHGISKQEIQAITVKMEDKDDEGKPLEWDKALELYPEFKAYCEQYPEVAEAARLLIDRNRTGGVHAGGLIISDRPIDGFVPLEVRSVTKANPKGVICSAWTEGLNAQDLQPVGLIKFDLLVINNLMQIALACDLVKRRHGLKNICAEEGGWDWSDISYLNDPKALEMANRGDLKCIFQFDSEGMRKLVKRGGVTRFDDLAAYSALYRPGPLNMGMDVKYCRRKKGEEPYNLHPLMQPILGKTYGVMIFQEQVMDILRVVGNVPDMHTEKVRKAISKKKVKEFIKYKEAFIEHGKINLSVNAEFLLDLWDQIESFAEYGFNKSVDISTLVPYPGGVKEIASFQPGESVFCVNEDGQTVQTEVVAIHDHGVLDAFEVSFDDGHAVVCSADHKFLTNKGQMPLREICRTCSSIYVDEQYGGAYGKGEEWWLGISVREGICNVPEAGATLNGMSRVRSDQKREHPFTNGEVEQGQRRSCQTQDILGHCKTDFGSTGDSYPACSQPKEVAGRESRQIRQMYGGGLEESQTVSNGSVASGTVGLGDEASTLRRGKKTSRFCEGKCLDRGGWVLPFLQPCMQSSETVSRNRSATGRNVKERSITSKGCDVSPGGHDVFQEQFGSDAGGMVQSISGHAPITDTRRLASRRVVRVRYVGKRRMCDLEVANPTHNFLLPNGVVTSNSHAYAYTYISSRLLWLKAHYPLEFYNAILMCENDDDKFREYKLDAKYHGVEIKPIDINKSKVNFHIDDGKIYFGFKNIKGIGEGVAERIVEHQPYSSFPDFLERFGTDGGTLKALCAIGVFDKLEPHHDHEHLRKFHEFYKDHIRKRRDRQKRFETSLEKKDVELRELLLTEIREDDPDLEQLCQFSEQAEKLWESRFAGVKRVVEYKSKGEIKTKSVLYTKLLQDLAKKRASALKNFQEKETEDDESPITLDQFNTASVKLDEEEVAILCNKMVLNGETTYPVAESMYYGFQWTHVLETSPEYSGETIDRFLDETENSPEYKGQAGPIEVIVRSVRKRTSRGEKKTEFYSVDVEDANARHMTVNVWSDDYTRWHEELKAGNMLRMRVRPPSGGFNTLTFDSVPKRERHKLPPKEDDDRIMVLPQPEKPAEEPPVDLDGFTVLDVPEVPKAPDLVENLQDEIDKEILAQLIAMEKT